MCGVMCFVRSSLITHCSFFNKTTLKYCTSQNLYKKQQKSTMSAQSFFPFILLSHTHTRTHTRTHAHTHTHMHAHTHTHTHTHTCTHTHTHTARFSRADQHFPLCYHYNPEDPSSCVSSVDYMQIFIYPVTAYVVWQLSYIILVGISEIFFFFNHFEVAQPSKISVFTLHYLYNFFLCIELLLETCRLKSWNELTPVVTLYHVLHTFHLPTLVYFKM